MVEETYWPQNVMSDLRIMVSHEQNVLDHYTVSLLTISTSNDSSAKNLPRSSVVQTLILDVARRKSTMCLCFTRKAPHHSHFPSFPRFT